MTDDTHCCDDEDLTRLLPPVRNRYFYGKQMGVEQFRRDQLYDRYQAWLLNRLLFGPGIACGLEVAVVDGVLTASPGVAIDGFGRVVIVPEATAVPVPPTKEPYRAGLWLCYCERCILPAPSGGDPCHPNARSEFDAIEESFRLDLRPLPPTAKGEAAARPLPTRRGCAAADEPCVELATLALRPDGIQVTALAPVRHGSPTEQVLADAVRQLERKVSALEDALRRNG